MQWPDGVRLRLPQTIHARLGVDENLARMRAQCRSIELESNKRAEITRDLKQKIILPEEVMADSKSTPGADRPNPNEKLVRVFDTEQESEAMVVRGLLDSAGIESDLTSLDAQQDILPGRRWNRDIWSARKMPTKLAA